jgi:hypothetical protein
MYGLCLVVAYGDQEESQGTQNMLKIVDINPVLMELHWNVLTMRIKMPF